MTTPCVHVTHLFTQVADTLEDSAAVIGFEQCMSLLVGPLAELSQAVAQGHPFDWPAAEAVLFCVRCKID